MAEQHLTHDRLVDLALDGVADREPLLRHLSGCSGCRTEYDAVSAAVDHTLAAAPRSSPHPASTVPRWTRWASTMRQTARAHGGGGGERWWLPRQ